MKRSVAIVSGNHLCNNPRVLKEAISLQSAGFDTTVLGAWFDPHLKERDLALLAQFAIRFRPVLDFAGESLKQKALRACARARGKFGRSLFTTLGIENHWQLGLSVRALRKEVSRLQPDLAIAHSEPAMAALAPFLRGGIKIGLDMEDWYSEDLLPEARRHRPLRLLKELESTLLQNAVHTSSPSLGMSEALASEYGCRQPSVIYNAFPRADRQFLDGQIKDRRDLKLPSIHWYSQTIGLGRGLEDLIRALPLLNQDVEIHLRGTTASGFESWLAGQVPPRWQNLVFLHPTVPPSELLSRIAEHDIGLAGEMKYCRSRDLTITNKILHYLLGGLAVVASNTSGQKEVASKAPDAVSLYSSGEPATLAAALNLLLSNSDLLSQAKRSALMAAQEEFYWEKSSTLLLQSLERALAGHHNRFPADNDLLRVSTFL